ncbi:MAG TPA: 1,4-alpha-glucan branching protein domain-containing protein [Bacillota bacterium]|nr:1,4-alpha-glucan branching protein domain-containing protein [Bacillota bacterium]
MEKGYLALVLHAHLPYVRHPEFADFLEEDWFYEAITETYIPLLKVFQELTYDGIKFRITMSLSPTLLSMMKDPLLQQRYLRKIENLISLAEKEVARTKWLPQFHETALMYLDHFRFCHYFFAERYRCDISTAFRELVDAGVLELITCGATHGFLPLMLNPAAMGAQIKAAVENHVQALGIAPRGIWLPECGYKAGIDEFLRREGLRFFFTDSHGVMHASPRPKYGVFAPIYCPSGVAAFGRDLESSKQVWSANEGYPGDPDYREFYRDIGYDLEYEYIRPHLPSSGIRVQTGMKYHRITGRTSDKQPYNSWVARERAAQHAGNFMFNREKQVEYLASILDRPPIIVSPYDAELFGHWWFEGPQWLNYLIRKITFDQKTIKLISPGDYLEMFPRNQVSVPSMSSWGYKGYNEVWLEGSNDWIYRHLHKAADRMVELACSFPGAGGDLRRALNQAARELLLLQSSDWAFIMKTGTMVDYAIKRTKVHINRFNNLYDQIKYNRLDMQYLQQIEEKDNIFPHLNYELYNPGYTPQELPSSEVAASYV